MSVPKASSGNGNRGESMSRSRSSSSSKKAGRQSSRSTSAPGDNRHALKNFEKRPTGGQSLQQVMSVGSTEGDRHFEVRPRSSMPPMDSSSGDDSDGGEREVRPPIPRAAVESARPRPAEPEEEEELPMYAEFFGLAKKSSSPNVASSSSAPPGYDQRSGSQRRLPDRPGQVRRQQSKDAWL